MVNPTAKVSLPKGGDGQRNNLKAPFRQLNLFEDVTLQANTYQTVFGAKQRGTITKKEFEYGTHGW